MEKKNNCLNVGFSTILWTVMAILLCASLCYAEFITVGPGEEEIIDTVRDDFIYVTGGIVVLKPYGYAMQGIYAASGSEVRILGCDIDLGQTGTPVQIEANVTVTLFTDSTDSIVLDTAIGPDATLDGTTITVDPTNGWTGKLTWAYEGTPYSLNISTFSNITIEIVGGGEPLEAQLWVFPGIINRFGPLSKILAMVRLPEGITKDDIDSTQALVLYANGYDDVEIEASCQHIIQWCRNGIVHTTIIASFEKDEVMAAVPEDGPVEFMVVGRFVNGDYFYGKDTVKIVSWDWKWW